MITLDHLKTKLNPEILNLENQLLTKNKELEAKEKQIEQLRDKLPVQTFGLDSGSLDYNQSSQTTSQEEELGCLRREEDQIKEQRNSLQEKLTAIYPFKKELNQLKKQNNELQYLYSLETSLKGRENENKQYEERLTLADNKHQQLEKKLDKVRDLVANNQLEKLKNLITIGKI